jgi:hypothetical protein
MACFLKGCEPSLRSPFLGHGARIWHSAPGRFILDPQIDKMCQAKGASLLGLYLYRRQIAERCSEVMEQLASKMKA